MKGSLATFHCIHGQTAIKSCQLTAMKLCQGQQISVRHLRRGQDSARINSVRTEKAEILNPEAVTWQGAELLYDPGDNSRRSGRVWILRVAENADNTIFRYRTGGPRRISAF